ncbi:hypothetical protein [Longispora fulva]|uniref:DUF4232 domain-containing protein n=1 Tax=Longispora fulva TaxID=619741 RepID=A0A8J7GYG6_9ACTN|nr:hypothetical protein [Longispora fulva]MBG6140536.1 hypothetical protein [Longispora fulva]
MRPVVLTALATTLVGVLLTGSPAGAAESPGGAARVGAASVARDEPCDLSLVRKETQKPTPVPGHPNQREAKHTLTVTNNSPDECVYTVGDTLQIPPTVTLVFAGVVGDGGRVQSPGGWNGTTQTTIAQDQPIDAGASHVWTVTYRYQLAR